ncbi:MAG: sigma-70 family RNA polymerase sigma factor [Clostridiales bacterium]|nr:sigma-70 family RNA polymerase sigma factor [Clostridiales bacterium]
MLGMLGFLALIDDESERRLFEELYCSYKNQMFSVARSILNNDAEAEDAVHDAFLKLAKRSMPTVSRIADGRDRRNYLLKMVKNMSLNMKRDRKPTVDPEDPGAGASALKSGRIRDDDFVNAICDRFEYERTVRAITGLDSIYRDVLYYHFVLELTIPQTAKALGRREHTVRKQLVRGKRLLIDKLEKNGGDLDD